MSPSGRWYTGSGIIRPVHLLIDNQAHFNRNSITLTTPTLEDDYTASKTGALNIEATGYSDSTNSNVYMEVTVLDADGKEVAKKWSARIRLWILHGSNLWERSHTPYVFPFSALVGTEHRLADAAGLEQTKAEQDGIAHAAPDGPGNVRRARNVAYQHRVDAHDNHNQERLESQCQ